jgi:ribosomal protein L24
MAAKLKKGDTVIVLTGKDKGKKGEISSVNPTENKAVVDGLNISIRHTKQSQASQGGRMPKAMPKRWSACLREWASLENAEPADLGRSAACTLNLTNSMG